jgi:hypothetical protein
MNKLRKKVLELDSNDDRFLALGPLEEAASLFRTTPENLLWNHTLFPFATAFTAEVDSDRAIRGMLGAGEARRHPGISRLSGVGQRRVCKQCIEEDIAARGESHWHRSHNLPGTFYCVKHRCLLHQTSVRAHRRTTTILPTDCQLLDPPKAWEAPGSWELAVACVAALTRPPGAGTHRSADFYLGLAVERGLLRNNGEVSQPALMELFQACFHTEFLEAASVEFRESRAWPSHAFSPRSRKLSPLRQLMMETALRHGTPRAGFLTHKGKGPPYPSRQEMDDRFSAVGVAVLEELVAASHRLMLAPFLKRIGAEHAWHVHKCEHPKLIAVVERLHAWNKVCPKPPRGPNWRELDDQWSVAAGIELERLRAAGETLTIRAFMERIGASVAWKHHNGDVSKLRLAAKRLQEWNDSQTAAAARSDRHATDERLAAAAATELERAIAAGHRVTLGAVMKRIGGVTAWQNHRSECPKLALIAERVRAWEQAMRG